MSPHSSKSSAWRGTCKIRFKLSLGLSSAHPSPCPGQPPLGSHIASQRSLTAPPLCPPLRLRSLSSAPARGPCSFLLPRPSRHPLSSSCRVFYFARSCHLVESTEVSRTQISYPRLQARECWNRHRASEAALHKKFLGNVLRTRGVGGAEGETVRFSL